MNTTASGEFPARLEKLRQRFEHWRQTHPPRLRIADSLWIAAQKAAGVYGLHRTARALRVNYYALKKRIEGGSRVVLVPRKESPTTTFVELPPLVSPDSGKGVSGSCECTLEWGDAGEAKLRLHFPAIATAELAALCQSLQGRSA